jgi:tetratricopeptide (TPR) repeat protein
MKQNNKQANQELLRRFSLIFRIKRAVIMLLLILLVAVAINNIYLRKHISTCRTQAVLLEKIAQTAQDSLGSLKASYSKTEAEALEYLQWQFVLKDQLAGMNDFIKIRLNRIQPAAEQPILKNILYYSLGANYMLVNDFEAAIQAFKKAVKFNDKDAWSYYNLGLLYSAYKNNASAAVTCYKKFLEFNPNGPKAQEVKERIWKLSAK